MNDGILSEMHSNSIDTEKRTAYRWSICEALLLVQLSDFQRGSNLHRHRSSRSMKNPLIALIQSFPRKMLCERLRLVKSGDLAEARDILQTSTTKTSSMYDAMLNGRLTFFEILILT